MFDRFLIIHWAFNLPGLEYARVVNMPRLHTVLRKLYFKDSQYFECLDLWISYGFEYIRSLNMLYFRVLNKILHRIYLTVFWIYHGDETCQGSQYVRLFIYFQFVYRWQILFHRTIRLAFHKQQGLSQTSGVINNIVECCYRWHHNSHTFYTTPTHFTHNSYTFYPIHQTYL